MKACWMVFRFCVGFPVLIVGMWLMGMSNCNLCVESLLRDALGEKSAAVFRSKVNQPREERT